ncbi:cysteine peptidase family C39 domain-containing protein [uncultured Helicobacter sp.]|uniref:cysteine peptidase family C39 domain-containing protein n=1 Tax=uncultured Helicobacter sp. TaxID=175537 RepID=UPI00262255C4|nr:cysteine peptidase family C39 domain-containing protein [uncultured Helicobacter sp.]
MWSSALATLFNFFGLKQFSEQEILTFLNHNTDMLSFKDLQEVAQKIGYTTKGFLITREILEKTTYPLLVRIENDPRFPHFVVVINYKGDFIKIYDPNFGIYISSKKEFYSIWDTNNKGGYALIIAKENVLPNIKELILPNQIFFK